MTVQIVQLKQQRYKDFYIQTKSAITIEFIILSSQLMWTKLMTSSAVAVCM